MRRFFAFVCVGLYLLAMVRPVLPYLEYAIQKDYIAKVFCVQKDIADNTCQGKCYRMQQIKKAQEDTPLPDHVKVNFKDYPLSTVTLEQENPFIARSGSTLFFWATHHGVPYQSDTFRPPQLV